MSRPHVKKPSAPFKLGNIESDHPTSCRINFKNEKKPPKYERKEKKERKFESNLDKFTDKRNQDSQRDTARQKQEQQEKRQDKKEEGGPMTREALDAHKRKQRQEVIKKGRQMGYSEAAINNDPHVYGKILKEIIFDQGGGETIGDNGIGFRDGSAVFFAEGVSGEQKQAMLRMVRERRKREARKNKFG